MRKGRLISGGAVLAVLAAGAGLPAAASVSGGWSATHTQTVTRFLPKAAGLLAADTAIRVGVVLAMRDRAGAATLAAAETNPANPGYGHYLSAAAVASRFAPSVAQVAAVTDYLRSQGLRVSGVDPNRLMIEAAGTAAAVEKAFHTRLSRFSLGGHAVFANTAPAEVPSRLGGDVAAVLGLNNVPMSMPIVTAAPKLPLTGYYPKEFQKVYDALSTPTAQGTSIAVMAEGDLAPVLGDLRYAEAQQHLPQVPVTVVPTGPATSDTSGIDEWDLDTQVSTGMAQSVRHLYIYDASTLTDFDIAHEINMFVAQNVAQIGSASLGEPDAFAYLDGSMLAIDQALEEAAVQGQSFFASTGDTGASCALVGTNGAPDSGAPAQLCYPADGTWTTAVGGTTLLTSSNDTYLNELAWNAGGGGASYFEYPGPWTANANPASAGGLRGAPDISMDADLTTGALIYIDKQLYLVGGTSLSSPLAMGSWARVQSAHGNRLGDSNLAFYGLYNRANPATQDRGATPGFHDVAVGSNGLYLAAPGWDYTTGIGSIDVAALDRQFPVFRKPAPAHGKKK